MIDQAESLRRLVNNKTENLQYEKDKERETKTDKTTGKTKIITITSGKGGVGKSNFVVNLAIALQKQGKKVLIFDADIGMGNDDVLMGIFPRYTMFDVIKGKEINDIVVEGPLGIKLLAGGTGINQIEDLKEDERKIFLSKLEALEGFDYILMDTGAGINRSVLVFIACSEETIIITTPEPTSLTDAYSLIKAADHFKIKNKASVVVNRVFNKQEGIGTFNKLKGAVNKFLSIDLDFIGSIEDDRKLVQGVRNQVPFSITYPNCEAAKNIYDISIKIIGDYENKTLKGIGAKGLFKKLFNLF